MSNLAEEYPLEQARVRELLLAYERIGPAGSFGASMIRGVLSQADKAAAEHDTVAMIAAFKAMQGCS